MNIKQISSITLIAIFICGNAFSGDRLEDHVKALASDIGKRGVLHHENLERAALYIKEEFASYGYAPEEQVYTRPAKPLRNLPFRNIIATKDGAAEKSKIVIVCAHYDSYRDAPGADDNASGVAAVLELARRLHDEELRKTVRFIAFSTEELELIFEDPDMGSYRYAREAKRKGEDIEAVVCIDMIGYFSDLPGSQHCPLMLKPFYPDRGDFIGFGSDFSSYPLLEKTVNDFKAASDVPVEYLGVPVPLLPDLMTSDNRSFWSLGYSSVWVTDTCIYRNPNMHTKKDTYDTIDYGRMSKVVDGLYNVILKLAGAT